MRRTTRALASLGLAVLAVGAAPGALGQKPENVLDNAAIVMLTEAGLPASAVVARIGIATRTDFDTAEAALAALSQAGVEAAVIEAVLRASLSAVSAPARTPHPRPPTGEGGIAGQPIEPGEAQPGWLGLLVQDVTPDLSEAFGPGVDRGALVLEVEPGSAAERGGVREGDVITEFNGEPFEGGLDLRNTLGLVRVGTEVELSLIREGRRETLRVPVGGAPEVAPAEGLRIDRLSGAEFRDIDPAHPEYGTAPGVLVRNVAPGSRAALDGLQWGDIVTAVNRRRVDSVVELAEALRETSGAFALDVQREDTRFVLVIE